MAVILNQSIIDLITTGLAMTVPEVFIIESLKLSDEKHRREGEIIYRSLKMADKNPIYHYIRTRKELKHFLDVFKDSHCRYLHISCHGNVDRFATTFDVFNDETFSGLVGPVLEDRRLFLSTCLATTENVAGLIFKKGGCRSVSGPVNKINFDDSAVLWTSFYHLMFKANSSGMKNSLIKLNLSKSALILDEKIRLFIPDESRSPVLSILPPEKSQIFEEDVT
jgi:hypothetical protein